MKRAIAVQEILRRILIVEDNGNLEEALTDVRKSYKKRKDCAGRFRSYSKSNDWRKCRNI